jgi:hypothetical protein
VLVDEDDGLGVAGQVARRLCQPVGLLLRLGGGSSSRKGSGRPLRYLLRFEEMVRDVSGFLHLITGVKSVCHASNMTAERPYAAALVAQSRASDPTMPRALADFAASLRAPRVSLTLSSANRNRSGSSRPTSKPGDSIPPARSKPLAPGP